MGGASDDVNKLCRVYSGAMFKVKDTKSMVQKCLQSFPFLWVSVIRVFIFGGYLMMVDIGQLLVCECQPLLTHLSYQLNRPCCVLLSSM